MTFYFYVHFVFFLLGVTNYLRLIFIIVIGFLYYSCIKISFRINFFRTSLPFDRNISVETCSTVWAELNEIIELPIEVADWVSERTQKTWEKMHRSSSHPTTFRDAIQVFRFSFVGLARDHILFLCVPDLDFEASIDRDATSKRVNSQSPSPSY